MVILTLAQNTELVVRLAHPSFLNTANTPRLC